MIIVIDRGILKREVVEFKYFAMENFLYFKAKSILNIQKRF